jgi:hypothetical protein
MDTHIPQRFTGWHRAGNGHSWKEICSADTEAACWQLLLGCCRSGDLLILPAGKTPDGVPADTTYARRRAGRSLPDAYTRRRHTRTRRVRR